MKNIQLHYSIRLTCFVIISTLCSLNAQTYTQGSGAMTNTANPVAGTDRVFIGSGAGYTNTATGINNTFVGMKAGYLNNSQSDNTFLGWHCGLNNGYGDTEPKAMFNTFCGSESGVTNTLGGNNAFFGWRSGYLNTYGDANVFLGPQAGYSNTEAGGNTVVGFQAGYFNTSVRGSGGSGNTISGSNAGYGVSGANYSYNSIYGTWAGSGLTTGSNNVFAGDFSGFKNTSGSSNVIVGSNAGYNNLTGANNVFLGTAAGRYTTSSNNTFGGYQSGNGNTTGTGNVFFGYNAGLTNTTGNSNTILGYSANVGSAALSNASAIGANTVVKNSNQMILGDNSTKVGINLSNDATGPLSVLSIGGTGSQAYETYSFNPSTADTYCGIKGEINTPGSSSTNKVYGTAGYANAGNGYGFGVIGWAYKSTTAGGRSYGVYGLAGNCSNGFNYGVYGVLAGSNTGYAGYFEGLLRTTNDAPEKPSPGSWTGYSDERLKKDVAPFTDGLAVLRQINPVTYNYNGIGGLDATKKHIGVIAQQVKTVAPYCVGTSQLLINQSDGSAFSADIVSTLSDSTPQYIVNALNYNQDGLFYAMINSIKQLDSTVTALQNQINNTQAASQRAGNNQADSINQNLPFQKITLASQKAILYQNNPNPANDHTSIGYYLSDATVHAEMVFFDMFGKEIKRVGLENKGNATLEIDTKDLDAGIYTYSLVVDGVVIDTLKMARAK